MATLSDYKGLEVVKDATGDGGIALTDNFKELADRAPYQAAANPGVNDDSAVGFSPGDQWLNTSTQVLWACISSSNGAAVWRSVLKRTDTELLLTPEESSGVSVNSTGPLRVPHGSQTAPAVQISSSAIGFYQAGGYLYIVTGSTPRWRVTPSGILESLQGLGGPLQVRAGVASSPTLSFSADIDTGFFLADTDTIGMSAGGTERARLSSDGLDISADTIRLREAKTPSSATDTGSQGDVCWDDDYVYVCVATNTWKRAPLATW